MSVYPHIGVDHRRPKVHYTHDVPANPQEAAEELATSQKPNRYRMAKRLGAIVLATAAFIGGSVALRNAVGHGGPQREPGMSLTVPGKDKLGTAPNNTLETAGKLQDLCEAAPLSAVITLSGVNPDLLPPQDCSTDLTAQIPGAIQRADWAETGVSATIREGKLAHTSVVDGSKLDDFTMTDAIGKQHEATWDPSAKTLNVQVGEYDLAVQADSEDASDPTLKSGVASFAGTIIPPVFSES